MTGGAAPAPWGECDICSAPTPGLPYGHRDGGHTVMCARCSGREAMKEAAAAQLEGMAAPAAQWERAGLRRSDLLGVLELAAGGWAERGHRGRLQAAGLYRLARRYAPQPAQRHRPARLELAPSALPRIIGTGQPPGWAPGSAFTVQEPGGNMTYDAPPVGLDAVLTLPTALGADAVLYFTGHRGQLEHRPSGQAYRVAPEALPGVLALLGPFTPTGGTS